MIRFFARRRVGKGASLACRGHSPGLLRDATLPTPSGLTSWTAWAKADAAQCINRCFGAAFAHPTLIALLSLIAPAFAQTAPSSPQPRQHISIGYVEIEGDP